MDEVEHVPGDDADPSDTVFPVMGLGVSVEDALGGLAEVDQQLAPALVHREGTGRRGGGCK